MLIEALAVISLIILIVLYAIIGAKIGGLILANIDFGSSWFGVAIEVVTVLSVSLLWPISTTLFGLHYASKWLKY